MKIMQVMAGAKTGGAENIFLESVLALQDGGFEQYVVTRRTDHRKDVFGARDLPVAWAPFGRWFKGPTKAVLAAANRAFQPDIVQYWMGRAGTYAQGSNAVNVGWYGGYYKLARFHNCGFHVALTKDIQRHIIEQGADPDDTGVIHTYADSDFAKARPTDRAGLNTPADAPVLLALARLHVKKGLDVLLDALAAVPGAYLWIAGSGPLEADLKAQCSRLGLDDRVRFLGWRNDRESLLAACDIVAFPSRYEPFGTVMVDAWAAKKPLIAAASQGPRVYVENEKNGMLVEIDDLEGLTTAIRRCVNEPALRKQLVKGGTRTYQSQFTKEVYIKDSRALYERLLSR